MQRPELEKLIKLYLQAEVEIVNEIARLRSLGLADYHVVAALGRVQDILRKLTANCWEYVPKMVEREFYVYHPELRRPEMYLTPLEHLVAYTNAMALTGEQSVLSQMLTLNLMKAIEDSTGTVMENLGDILGRRSNDIFRAVGNRAVALSRVTGSTKKSVEQIVTTIQQEGIPAFTDATGRNWSLHTYASMVTRTVNRQASVCAVLTKTDEDLFLITTVGTTCPVCAPLEGRVYSKSGKDPDFPPLSLAFGKIDPFGPDTLTNTYLNIHPNCLHSIVPWTKAGRSEAEIQRMIRFSSPINNPLDRDPRTDEQIKNYKRKEDGRRKYLNDLHQFERYRETIPGKTPKTFETFMKHKTLNDDKYKEWMKEYRAENRRMKDEADSEPD